MSVAENRMFETLAPVVEREGAELVEVKVAEISKKLSVTLFIHCAEHAVTLEDCERVHRAVDEPLDQLDPTEGRAYTLNVSSLGLDRPIRTDGDFRRNLGEEVTAKFFAPENGKKEISGVLEDFDAETFTLGVGGEKRVFERKKACKISLKLDF